MSGGRVMLCQCCQCLRDDGCDGGCSGDAGCVSAASGVVDAGDAIDVVGFSIHVFSFLSSPADFINHAEWKRAEAGGSRRKRPEAAGSGRKFSAMIHALLLRREKEKTLRYRIREFVVRPS